MAQQTLNRTKQQLKFKNGLVANINTTATKNLAVEGEPHFTTDTDTLFIFDGTQNVPIASRTLITDVNAATYDVLPEDHILSVSYTATGAVTITLPTAQVVSGRMLVIKDSGGNALVNNITIDTEGSETIDGGATAAIALNYDVVRLYCDGANWFTV